MKTRFSISILTALTALFIVGNFGCESAPGNNKPFPFGSFRLEGVFVSDPNLDTVRAIIQVEKEDDVVTTVEVSFDDSVFAPSLTPYSSDSVFYFDDRPYLQFPAGNHYVYIDDMNGFRDSALISLADSFVITSVAPFNRQIAGDPRTATLSWSVATNATGFVMAAVKTDGAYTGTGWSGYVQTFGNAGTIPPEAFLANDGINPDPGLYNLYVYAYWGVPDSALSKMILPVPFPSQLPDNIDRSDLDGRFGTIMVTFLDTVRVVQQN